MAESIDVSKYIARLRNHGPAYSICIPADEAKEIFDELVNLRKLQGVASVEPVVYDGDVNNSTIMEE